MHKSGEMRMEFHVSRQARDRYQFDQSLYTTTGNVVFANFLAARQFAQKMNEQRDLAAHPELAVRAGQINAMGLIDELLHLLVEQYRRQSNPRIMHQALEQLEGQLGVEQVGEVLRRFTAEFPPVDVYRGLLDGEAYLARGFTRPDGSFGENREAVLEELLMLWLENSNPAFAPFQELFSDFSLAMNTAYPQLIPALRRFFDGQPGFGGESTSLIELLRAPALAHPDSLTAQLEYIRTRWVTTGLLPEITLRQVLTSMDMVREEEKPVFGPGDSGPALVYDFKSEDYWYEPERFSRDLDWMPNLVLLAKNAYVWLDQLSRKYQRAINRLDQVPGVELDTMARWGIDGLWLIGLWERSLASRRIKQMRGSPEAVASAYSLYGYEIAADLGGEGAYQELRAQAWKRGIRLASDMVPNHMGIDSLWVIQHPHWFVSLDYSPFPTYSFNGPNLSWDERVGLFLEDHYYDNSDAAVVFKRVDFWTGSEKYIYHGNDGTSMPWNDTAQLNYLMPEVREAVIQTILHVARKFPIIRFDAAMTLAKRHFQRLWYPEPGTGGDIPSRAEHGLTKEQFDQAFPEEFWREVVDRVAAEAPDTLLLAEAFWLMEGYFVRTLGMHRVYNSAFMNMLRDEKNQEYRLVIKNTIEFDPEILKRYVNFMNNPDERTAVDQFGKGDKYFGVCTMLATLPGLPMIGHGQVEGFTEKYGMEYRYARWKEDPDQDLVRRHEREIFPLLRRRHLFAEARDFRLYDFYTPDGSVNEDVYAYSNRSGQERALVVYHNRYNDVRGWIHLSCAYPVRSGVGDEKTLVQTTLSQALELHNEPGYFLVYRDHAARLEFIRSSREICQQGLYLELGAYKAHVFINIREVQDDETGRYALLNASLRGRGAPALEEALKEMALQPVLMPFRELVNAGMLSWLVQNRADADDFEPTRHEMALAEAEMKLKILMVAIARQARLEAEEIERAGLSQTSQEDLAARDGAGEPVEADSGYEAGVMDSLSEVEQPTGEMESLAGDIRRELAALLGLALLGGETPPQSPAQKAALEYLKRGPLTPGLEKDEASEVYGILLAALLAARLGELQSDREPIAQSLLWLKDWLFGKYIAEALEGMGLEEIAAQRGADLAGCLVRYQEWCDGALKPADTATRLLAAWQEDPRVRLLLQVHPYEGVLWFNQESFDELVWRLYALQAARLSAWAGDPLEGLAICHSVVKELLAAEAQSGFQFEKLAPAPSLPTGSASRHAAPGSAQER